VLGGIPLEHDKGLEGHSDADAVLHAVTDAILGALAAGDIGDLFPDTDPRWEGADSTVFVRHALDLARVRKLRVENCDVTVLAEQPRLGSHKDEMRHRIAELLQVGDDAVAVKAKTNEGLDAVGRGEAIAAMALVLLTEET
jgi:2-C-methyl-D-erythritol 2,4-cyclodiphosphate synthase